MQSHSVIIGPADSRCRYWAKTFRSDDPLPLPSLVNGANDLLGKYAQHGEEELTAGDVLFEGEANHHRKNRGWTYWLTVVAPNGELLRFISGNFGELKAQMKAQGMSPDLLKGSGDIAAMVRIAHAIRISLTLMVED